MANPPSAYLHDAAAPDDLYAGKPPWDIDTTADPDGLPAWLVALTRF